MNALTKVAKLSIKNPRLAANKARITIRNSYTVKKDYKRDDGWASPPNTVSIKLTNACNLRCKMCGQQREGNPEGHAKWAPITFFQEKTNVEKFKSVIDEVKGWKPNLYLWGGEPFMYKDILELISYAKKQKLTVQINTNGLYLKKLAADVVKSGLDDLIISIDGPQEVHDQVRGLAGTFKLVEKGIQAIHEEKKKQGKKTPIVRVRGTISPYNFEYVYSLVEIAEQFGADALSFNWTWFTTDKVGKSHQKMMKKLFDIDATTWIPYVDDVILDPDKRTKFEGIKRELERFSNNKSKLPISMSPNVKPEQVDSYYENITDTLGNDACYSVWVKSYLLPNGDVTPCPDFPDYICGNIHEQSFMDIWNGEKYRKWRIELKKRKLFPICYRCCDLFLSDVKFV
jgi:radical SAM protein with 4Fe4S-binding SPASM domain